MSRRITLLDLRLGLVSLSEAQREAILRHMAPVLVGAARRVYEEPPAPAPRPANPGRP